MSCCAAATSLRADDEATPPPRAATEGVRHADFVVPGIHCAACIQQIERGLDQQAGVLSARVNLSTRRVAVDFDAAGIDEAGLIAALEGLGYAAQRFDPDAAGMIQADRQGKALLRALAVAGFAAANVMLLSVSVWSGADEATRALFHWISALIALPAVIFAGRPFYASAFAALRRGRLNMDVPISLGVLLASALSLHAAIGNSAEAYFDAAVMLLFFLLTGRYLDHMMRDRARSAVTRLLSLWATEATVLDDDGRPRRVPVKEIRPGMLVQVAAGERLPVDGEIVSGRSEIDRSLLTGESIPVAAGCGDEVHAGTMNLLAPLVVKVGAVGDDTFLAEIVRLMEAAESGRARFVRIADRATRFYAPAVHLIALSSFVGWMLATGGDWYTSITIAITVLIITCPCALALAVPAVHVVASGVLFRAGAMLKDGTALERLAEVRRIAFDKTGTLTRGTPCVRDESWATPDARALAAGLAARSRHPLAVALARHLEGRGVEPLMIENVEEIPGKGLQGTWRGRPVRLGRTGFAGAAGAADHAGSELRLSLDGREIGRVALQDQLREDAAETVAALAREGYEMRLLSGDRAPAVAATASALGLAHFAAELSPAGKVAAIEAMREDGRGAVMMVGDGINDAPALAAAHVSMAPASASDIGRTAADLVFLGERLDVVPFALDVARRARRLVLQNFGLAIAYNAVAIPIAVLGGASPLVAAIVMSSSSLIVTLNAIRLRLARSAVTAGAGRASSDRAFTMAPAGGST